MSTLVNIETKWSEKDWFDPSEKEHLKLSHYTQN